MKGACPSVCSMFIDWWLFVNSTQSLEFWILATEMPPRGCCVYCKGRIYNRKLLTSASPCEIVWLTLRPGSDNKVIRLVLILGVSFPNQRQLGGHSVQHSQHVSIEKVHTCINMPSRSNSFSKQIFQMCTYN